MERGVAVGQPVYESTDRTPGSVRADSEWARQVMLAEVFRRRSRAAELERETQDKTSPLTLLRARQDILEALENYSAALRLRGWPTPTKMTREIHLLRSLLGRARRDT